MQNPQYKIIKTDKQYYKYCNTLEVLIEGRKKQNQRRMKLNYLHFL